MSPLQPSCLIPTALCFLAVLLSSCSGERGASDAGQPSESEAVQGTAVSHFNTYTDVDDSVVAIAVVENTRETPLETVEIAMILKDANGDEIKRRGASIPLLPPGEAIPVKVVFDDAGEHDRASVEPLVWRASRSGDPGIDSDFALSGIEETAAPPASSYLHEVTGTVENTGSTEADFITVHAAFFDAGGELTAVGTGGVDEALAPGAKGDFSIGTNTAAGEIARTELSVAGARTSA